MAVFAGPPAVWTRARGCGSTVAPASRAADAAPQSCAASRDRTLAAPTGASAASLLHQLPHRAQIQVQLVEAETEPARDVTHGVFQRHQRAADVLGLLVRQR